MQLSAVIPRAAVRPMVALARPQLAPARVVLPVQPKSTSALEAGNARRVPAMRAVPQGGTAVHAKEKVASGHRQAQHRPQIFVGLPVDVVSAENTLNHAKAIAVGLKALKLLGVAGVEIPIWWGVVENNDMGKYDWSAYLELAQMIQDAGLQIHASLYFHASKTPAIPLPTWLTRIGEADPSIYFVDKSGQKYTESLSLAIDSLPVLEGRTPVHVYEAFFQSFQDTFNDFMGSTITDITIGLGPGGELRYPSVEFAKNQKVSGVGEFQCYDPHMLALLKKHAEDSHKPYWGLSGPHDAPRCDQTPESGNFFKEHGGSWETPYGDFFLSWYSELLLSHGDRLLSAAAAAFGKQPAVTMSARVPVMPSWYKLRSHPLELTTGYYNTDGRDGYDAVARMFAKNSCRMILTGMELVDDSQPAASQSSPESLLAQIISACTRHDVHVIGENSSMAASGFDRIKSKILSEASGIMDSFTYQRMGAAFFSPEHWPLFAEFIRSIGRPALHVDDFVSGEEETVSFDVGSIRSNTREVTQEKQAV